MSTVSDDTKDRNDVAELIVKMPTEELIAKLTTEVSKAVHPIPSCWAASLILRDVLESHGLEAQLMACSVRVGTWYLEEHCVVACDGYICDPTAFQIPTAPQCVVSGPSSVGDVRYLPCDSPEYIQLVSDSWSVSSGEAVSNGLISETVLQQLLTPHHVSERTSFPPRHIAASQSASRH